MFFKKANVNCEFGIYVTSLLYLDILYTRLIHWHTTCFYGVLHITYQLIDGELVACVCISCVTYYDFAVSSDLMNIKGSVEWKGKRYLPS